MIVVDGIYSTDGSIAPLSEINKIAKRYQCRVMVDEAHGLGILGEKGVGATEYLNQIDEVDIIMGTMSKSLAGVGGFVASNKEVIEYLRFYARSYLFSTNIPPAVACGLLKSLTIIRTDKSIREQLHHNINFFKDGLKKLNLNIGDPKGAVIPIFISDLVMLHDVSEKLFDKGIFHNVMSYPAVPMGGSLIRFGIMATHTEKELKYALDSIESVLKEVGMI
jgi:glycine C-acetyltransferase